MNVIELQSDINQGQNTVYIRHYDHIAIIDVSFVLKCSQTQHLFLFYLFLSAVNQLQFLTSQFWVIACTACSFWTLYLKAQHSMYLQRLVLVFPVLKTLHTLIITANIGLCENQEQSDTANKYLIMGLISFETLFETILLTMFLVLAKGWGIVRFYVLREEATQVTIILGLVYLHYSAFFVTIEISYLNRAVKVLIAVIYVVLFYVVGIKYLKINIKMLNQNIRHAQDQMIPQLAYALQLKRQMIVCFTAAAIAYMIEQLGDLLIVSPFADLIIEHGFQNMIIMHNEIVDAACIMFLYLTLRPREWPLYFSINVQNLVFSRQQSNQESDIEHRFIPLTMELNLRRKEIIQDQSFDSRGSLSNLQVAILNPCDDSRVYRSSFEDDKFKITIATNLQLAKADKRQQDQRKRRKRNLQSEE